MTSTERRAVKRALGTLFTTYTDEPSDVQSRDMPGHAVRLAQVRAGRIYSWQTQSEGREYARQLLKTGF